MIPDNPVSNFMGGISYRPINPLIKLWMISASFIRGESVQYYRKDNHTNKQTVPKNSYNMSKYAIFPDTIGTNSIDIFDQALQDALAYDFEGTLNLAGYLRHILLMRKNPQCIMMEAARHPNRAMFNLENPGIFKTWLSNVIERPDDMTEQLKYWIGKFGSKAKLPTCVKKVWANTLETMLPYQLLKYKRFIPDLVRISHARSDVNAHLDSIMKTGTTTLSDKQLTWETLRSRGMSWYEILETLEWKMPHMAALRNLIPFARSVRDTILIEKYGQMLIGGVEYGKQFPFRYITAYRQINKQNDGNGSGGRGRGRNGGIRWHPKKLRKVDITHLTQIIEQCLQKSMINFPKLDGDTLSLCDNSGSAQGAFTSTYGTVRVADIANLSALFTAYNTNGRGVVGIFGDKLELFEVNKQVPLLKQYDAITNIGKNIGTSTENGIWIAFERSFKFPQPMRFDNIFIYSDMQAGHGGLYGTNPNEYREYLVENNPRHIDVLKLVQNYRQIVNPLVNLFSVQVAGYDNNLLPENIYRGAIMSGWTGNEVVYAKRIIDIWNNMI